MIKAFSFFRLGSNSDIAWKINAEIVTKPEAVTIAELFSYIKQENAKVQGLLFLLIYYDTLGYL